MKFTFLLTFFLYFSPLGLLAEQPEDSSPHAHMLEASFSEGEIVSPSENTEDIEDQVRRQLRYLIGTLNGYQGGAAINSTLDVSVGEREILPSGLYRFSYTASVLLAWNRSYGLPTRRTFLLPSRADDAGLRDFYRAYQHCKEEADYREWNDFFYYYRPQSCRISERDPLVVGLDANLSLSQKSVSQRSPEFELIWKDNQLRTIAIFGDSGTRFSGVSQFYQYLRKWFGRPASDQYEYYSGFRVRNQEYSTHLGQVVVETFELYGEHIHQLSDTFDLRYEQSSVLADYVAYNGHSGYGKNIAKLSSIGKFTAGQYKLFYLNGCDTFSYFNSDLIQRHQSLNPNFGPTKYIDVITTAMPSYFKEMAYGSARILWALANQKENYEVILRNIRNGIPLVIGDEDNR